MRQWKLQRRIITQSNKVVMIVAVLALVVLNVFDGHVAGTWPHDPVVELVQIDDKPLMTKAQAKTDESDYCQSAFGCHVALTGEFTNFAWTDSNDTFFAAPFDKMGSSLLNGHFRPPKHI
ncbi:hypothetical protein [Pararhizobium sp. IMCC21322]|uniref:hypothetical protein n=1 Tax=Pararhizobium sp. IMCC21322 TaxID=3067903 RepID=UPI002741F79C|nr:hypothetical protein [Pararhizobium sp. IMCC21322]